MFDLVDTGGGCSARGYLFDGGRYLLITMASGPDAPTDENSEVCVGLYAPEGEIIEQLHGLTYGEFQRAWAGLGE